MREDGFVRQLSTDHVVRRVEETLEDIGIGHCDPCGPRRRLTSHSHARNRVPVDDQFAVDHLIRLDERALDDGLPRIGADDNCRCCQDGLSENYDDERDPP